jgi:hypothetical protein
MNNSLCNETHTDFPSANTCSRDAACVSYAHMAWLLFSDHTHSTFQVLELYKTHVTKSATGTKVYLALFAVVKYLIFKRTDILIKKGTVVVCISVPNFKITLQTGVLGRVRYFRNSSVI